MARKPKSEATKSRIALLREERGWSQAELADKLFINQRAISDIERGFRKKLETYEMLAKIFNVSIDYLLERTDVKNIPDNNDSTILNLICDFSQTDKEKLIKHIEVERAYM